jgi:hypothetical protein
MAINGELNSAQTVNSFDLETNQAPNAPAQQQRQDPRGR